MQQKDHPIPMPSRRRMNSRGLLNPTVKCWISLLIAYQCFCLFVFITTSVNSIDREHWWWWRWFTLSTSKLNRLIIQLL
jgi:hypothetical protein